MAPKSERNTPGARRGRRAAQASILVVSAVFIVGSTWEVQRQVFGAPLSSQKTVPSCSYALSAFDEAVTRGLTEAAAEASQGKAEAAFEDTVSTPLSSVEKHCTTGDDGSAFAAATRLKEAAEATVDAQHAALAPLRMALQVRRNP